MSSNNAKSLIKYVLSLLVGIGILWLLLHNFDFARNRSKFENANYWWIGLSIVLSWLSHWIRAYRWKLLINPIGHNLSTFRGFVAVMVGYLANLVFPRMGEISRCAVLKKTDNIPMTTSIGTVVAERLLDLLMLIFLLLLVIILEFDIVYEFFSEIIFGKIGNFIGPEIIISGFIGFFIIVLVALAIFKMYNEKIMASETVRKFKGLLTELIQGFMSILKIESPLSFWGSTVFIWFLYYLMSYVVIFALDATQHLGILAGLSILVAGGIGMSAPVQGGIGTYHIMVMGLLALYGIDTDDGKVFAVILHTSQTISVVVVGLISLTLSFYLKKHKESGIK